MLLCFMSANVTHLIVCASIHVFPVARVQDALVNTELTRQMAAIADTEQTSSQGDELIV